MLHYFLELYKRAIYDTDQAGALVTLDKALEEGLKAEDLMYKIVIPVMDDLIMSYINKKAILSQHYVTAKISELATEMLVPLFTKHEGEKHKIVLGTSYGDFHGLGKKIVGGALRANMIEVIDLGINVLPEKFVETATQEDAPVIGISSMMVHTALGAKGALKVRQILDDNGLSTKIKLIVGGAPYKFDNELYKKAGADDWAENGMEAANLIRKLLKN